MPDEEYIRVFCPVDAEQCANCAHFVRHYTKLDGQFRLIHLGHCVYPRVKYRRLTETCQHFERKQAEVVKVPSRQVADTLLLRP